MPTSKIYSQFSKLIAEKSGIQLSNQREQTLRNCVSVRMHDLHLSRLEDYYSTILADATGHELHHLIDSIAINFTSFFRDKRQFTILENELGRLIGMGRRKIRVWSMACSTGEEPYSIAMCAHRELQKVSSGPASVSILGTDISTAALRHAQRAIYDLSSIEELPSEYLACFSPVSCEPSSHFQLIPTIKDMVVLRRMNLTDETWRLRGEIDVIFCRNVLIYFDQATQEKVVRKAISMLRPGGLLFLGACESMRQLIMPAESVAPSVFRRCPSDVVSPN